MEEGNKVNVLYRAVRNGDFSKICYCKINDPLTLVLTLLKIILKKVIPL